MQTAPAQTTAGDYFVYVGSYTGATSASRGIYALRFDSKSGALTSMGLAAETVNPAHVWATPDGRFLYAVNWQGNETVKGDTVSSFAIDRKSGSLTFLNKVSAGGVQPNQIVVDPSGKIAITVNYNSGTIAAYAIEADGRLTNPVYKDEHRGRPLSRQQPGPRAHGVVFSKDSRFAYVAELGLDRIYTYRVDTNKRVVMPADPPFVALNKAGSGPRRLQLHPNGRFLYVNHETDSAVSVFKVDGARLTQIQSVSTLPADYSRNNSTAEIQIDRSGKFLYVTNRGHDSIAVFAVDASKGTLAPIAHVPSGGRTPRNITIDPTNQYLFAANQNGDNVAVFRIDPKTGNLMPTGAEARISQPGGMCFVRIQ